MNLAKTTFSFTQLTLPSTYSIYRRIANLVLAVLGLLICVNLWLLSTDQAQNWHDKQANQLGRSLSQQGAMVLTEYVRNKDTNKITRQLEYLLADDNVVGAALFDHRGQLIDSVGNSAMLVANYRLKQTMPLIFIAEITTQEQIYGYLRLALDEEKVMQYHQEYQQQVFQQILVLMLLAGVVGILVARAFYKFRARYYQKHSERMRQLQSADGAKPSK
jgi:membrane protein